MPLLLNDRDTTHLKKHYRYISLVVVSIFFVLFMRLFYLQILRGDEFKLRSEYNSIRVRYLNAPRGIIKDAEDISVAENQPSFDLIYVSKSKEEIKDVLERIKALYSRYGLTLEADRDFSGKTRPFSPVIIERNLDWRKIAILEAHALDMPGFIVEVSSIRKYLEGKAMAHVVGYTGEINQEELTLGSIDGLLPGDLVGRSGVEQYLDGYLRGKPGVEQVEVDVYGRVVRTLGKIDPVAGCNVRLFIYARLQRVAYEALNGRAGAVVALDPRNGAVLALVSSPSFDPNAFAGGITKDELQKILKDPLKPFENRAVAGLYPPGSTFKVIVAAAALEEGIVTPISRFFCNGTFDIGSWLYHCWQKGGHGWVSLHRAIVESCDVYFYNLGRLLGIDKIAYYARSFGLGSVTDVDLPREKAGLVPSDEWKKKRFKEQWRLGDTIAVSVGQGYNLITPLQLAVTYAAFANGGTLWKPRIISAIETPDGQILKNFPPEIKGTVPISKKNMELIATALRGVVNEDGGTGRAAKIVGIEVAGKTGTAQVVSIGRNGNPKTHAGNLQDHALFVAYAPYDNPEIVVAVIVEHGGSGGAVAAPIARKVIETYMQIKKDKISEGRLEN
ncbi:MAG: penicillin-binding protein 2 [Syntrophales bacterium]|nr:penicillin-binding protein 2 [Syntrophales bacterium]